MLLVTVNPVGYVIGRAIDRYTDESEKLSSDKRQFIKEISVIANNPVGFVFHKLFGLFRPKKNREFEMSEV